MSMNAAAVDSKQIAGIGCHLVDPTLAAGGSISQLSAGISIKNFNEAPRKKIFKKNHVSDMDVISSSNRMSTQK